MKQFIQIGLVTVMLLILGIIVNAWLLIVFESSRTLLELEWWAYIISSIWWLLWIIIIIICFKTEVK